jgi:hypothetical protein
MPELFAAIRAAALAAQPLADSPEVPALRAALRERRCAAASAASAAAAADDAAEGGCGKDNHSGGGGGAAKAAATRTLVCNDVTAWGSLSPRASPVQWASNVRHPQPLTSAADSFAAVAALSDGGRSGVATACADRSDSKWMERKLRSIVSRTAGNSDGSGWRYAGGGGGGGHSEGQDVQAAVKLLREEVRGRGLEGRTGRLTGGDIDVDSERDRGPGRGRVERSMGKRGS